MSPITQNTFSLTEPKLFAGATRPESCDIMITPITAAVHTVLLGGPSEATLHNHRWYCSARGYSHHCHAISSPGNSARTLLTYKYSVVRKVLANTPAGALLIFADDTAAFY